MLNIYETNHRSYDKFMEEERKHFNKAYLCGPQSNAGSLNWHSVIKTWRTPAEQQQTELRGWWMTNKVEKKAEEKQ